jgi:CheY-like chemotaxis protein
MADRIKILVVDDDAGNVEVMRELLEDKYDWRVATHGSEAIKMAFMYQPEIILMDVMMQGMDGYEVCRRLREFSCFKSTKIIIMSSRAMVSDIAKGYEAGADDYVSKPFDGIEFLDRLEEYSSEIKNTNMV